MSDLVKFELFQGIHCQRFYVMENRQEIAIYLREFSTTCSTGRKYLVFLILKNKKDNE